MENKKVPSANDLTSYSMLPGRSLMHIKKKSDPNIEPCGTTVWTNEQDEDWPLRTTPWNYCLENLEIR